MGLFFLALAVLAAITGLICWIIVLIDAFQDEVWKGLLGLFCGFYLLYFAIFDFDHEHKWLIIIGAFGGSSIAAGLATMAG